MARVVFDPGMPPSSYAGALRRLHPVADVMGQPVDSSETTSFSLTSVPGEVRGVRRGLPPRGRCLGGRQRGQRRVDRPARRRRGQDHGGLQGRDRCRQGRPPYPLLQPRLRGGQRTPDVHLGGAPSSADAAHPAHLRPDLLLPERLPRVLADARPGGSGCSTGCTGCSALAARLRRGRHHPAFGDAGQARRPPAPLRPRARTRRPLRRWRVLVVVRGGRRLPRRPVWKALAADMRAAR